MRVSRSLIFTVLAIVSGGRLLAAAPESDVARLEKENRELREKLLQTEKELSNYRLWLGNIAFDHRQMSNTEREKRALLVLEELAKRGNGLSMASFAVSDECRRLLEELPLGPARKAQVELRLDELESAAMNFAALTIPRDFDIGSCRVLAIDRNLKAVVVSAGTGSGVFPGMILTAKGKPDLKLRVVGCRFEGAVAEPVSGKLHDFSPGMEINVLQQAPVVRERILEL